MYTLFYFPGNASLLPHMLLREIGAPFELSLVDRANNAQKSAEYLKLNPMGQIPVLIDGGLAISETAAIALHLADRHPQAGLAPPLASPLRGPYLKWMLLLTNALQTQYRAWFYAHEFVDNPDYVDSVKAATAARIGKTFAVFADHLEANEWLLGEEFSAADLYLFMMVRWGRALPSPPRLIPSLARHAGRVASRPAVREALKVEGVAPPYF
ncbi:MAG TPA: glutathione S-transferase N-terminal domain-containing protein [Rhizomicrobium sp.]